MWSRIALAITCFVALPAVAGPVTLPWTFQPDTPAVASQVNDNFGAVATGVNGNAADIAALLAQITALQGSVTTLQGDVTTLQGMVARQQSDISTLQGTVAAQGTTITTLQANVTTLTSQLNAVATNPVLGLGAYVSLQMLSDPQSGNSYPTAVFDGVNVRISNGTGRTDTANGLGNLTIGYNEADDYALEFCSNGTYGNRAACEANGSTWAANQRSGSHTLVVGYSNAYTQFAGLVVGDRNIVNGPYASVSGGVDNTARGYWSSVSGGQYNTASGDSSSVSGGYDNTASNNSSSVSGGIDNNANSYYSSVSGGYRNTASNNSSSVSGGIDNNASGPWSSVSGGANRNAGGNYDWAAGGLWQDQ